MVEGSAEFTTEDSELMVIGYFKTFGPLSAISSTELFSYHKALTIFVNVPYFLSNVMTFSLVAIIPAGGVGERAQHQVHGQSVPKQYRQIAGLSMLHHSVRALLADQRVQHVFIGVAPNDGWIQTQDFTAYEGRVTVLATGGASRADTVLNTLKASTLEAKTWVLVHDAARPGLPQEALSQLISQCLAQQRGGLLALPVGDTVKRARQVLTSSVAVSDTVVSAEGVEGGLRVEDSLPEVDATISREGLWLAQTPQMFASAELIQALESALAQGFEITDEASAIEFMGGHPLLLKGHWRNLKVTWPSDFDLVEQFL